MSMHDHGTLLEKVKSKLPQDAYIGALSELFKIFAEPTRMKILYALLESELCVCAITEILSMNQSAISHQLKILRDANLVGYRRVGKTIVYFLSDDHVRHILVCGSEHLLERKEKYEL